MFVTVLLVGGLIGVSLLLKSLLYRVRIPGLVGWICLGLLCRIVDLRWSILTEPRLEILDFLSYLGVAALLFRIGLESDFGKLLGELRPATIVWAANVVLSGAVGFAASYFLLGLNAIQSLLLGVALTATSVGVTVTTWREAHMLDTREGHLLLDVAELDDASSILLMGFIFALLPALNGSGAGAPVKGFTTATLSFLGRMAALAGVCLLFARYAERPLMRFVAKQEDEPDQALTVASVGLIVAAVAALMGFSLALGAFFAGLAFSRDPRAIKLDASFKSVYELFGPFFFIGIGLSFSPEVGSRMLVPAVVLLLAAIVGKVAGTSVPAAATANWPHGLVLGISMVPRAEITMVILERGRAAGSVLLPPKVFSAMVVVSLLTCILAPITTLGLLKRMGRD